MYISRPISLITGRKRSETATASVLFRDRELHFAVCALLKAFKLKILSNLPFGGGKQTTAQCSVSLCARLSIAAARTRTKRKVEKQKSKHTPLCVDSEKQHIRAEAVGAFSFTCASCLQSVFARPMTVLARYHA